MAELKRLHSAWEVDRTIVLEGDKVILLRLSKFERLDASSVQNPAAVQHHESTKLMDEILVQVARKVRKYCVIYAVDTVEVAQFDRLYELGDPDEPFALMFFYRSRHIKLDVGSGNVNKVNFLLETWDVIPLVDASFKAGRQGKSIAYSEKKFHHAVIKR